MEKLVKITALDEELKKTRDTEVAAEVQDMYQFNCLKIVALMLDCHKDCSTCI